MSELDRHILVEEYGEIDIQHFPGNFYRDSVVSAGNAVYTYQNIPADRVTRIH